MAFGSLKANWTTYRQGLRDITCQVAPLNITWPLKFGEVN